MDRPEKSSREASGAELWPISEKSDQKLGFRTIFPTQCLPCSPPPTGLPGLVSPAGYAQRSDLPDLQEPRNFRKRGEYPKQPAKKYEIEAPPKAPQEHPRSTPTSPGTHRKCPESTRKSTWKIHGKMHLVCPGKKPGNVHPKQPECTQRSPCKVP